jgi:hypothetical protein
MLVHLRLIVLMQINIPVYRLVQFGYHKLYEFTLSKVLARRNRLVYCTRCGTLNPDTNINCSNCGAPLYGAGVEYRPYSRREYRHYYDDRYQRHHRGGGFGLLIAGIFIIIIGLAALTGFTAFWSYFWPLVLVLIGLWILLIGLRRNRRYRQPSPP